MMKFVIVDCRSFGVNLFLKMSIANAMAIGGTIPPIMTEAIMPELTAAPEALIREAVPKTYAALLIGPPKSMDIIPPMMRPRIILLDVVMLLRVSEIHALKTAVGGLMMYVIIAPMRTRPRTG